MKIRKRIIPSCHPNRKHVGRKLCNQCYQRWWSRKNERYIREYKQKYYQKNHTEQLAKQREYRRKNKARILRKAKNHKYKFHYGISLSEYRQLANLQNWRCAICSRRTRKRLHVDHCHNSNRVRGLLCMKCNVGIGLFEDKIEILNVAINYLKNDGIAL